MLACVHGISVCMNASIKQHLNALTYNSIERKKHDEITTLESIHQNPQLTIEADSTNVAEQLFAVDAGHARAEAWVSIAELPVHAVQGMGHGVHGIHHKLNLALLFVTGITTNFF